MQDYVLEADFDLIEAALQQVSSTDTRPPKVPADPVEVCRAITRMDDTLHDSYLVDRPPYTAVHIGVSDYLAIVQELEAKLGPR
jgi:hypothetical protein